MATMPAVMTSWKELAQYLGKGVRTVQRWENQFGLPVRRRNTTLSKCSIFALPEEIDAWIRQNQPREGRAAFQQELARLRQENLDLRSQVMRYESQQSAPSQAGANGLSDVPSASDADGHSHAS
jgi:hypothetical protein